MAIFRSQALIHAYCSKKNYKRRYYKIYNYGKKKLLYLHGKEYMNYSWPKVNFSYTFYAKTPKTINLDEYNTKKLAAFREEDTESKTELNKHVLQRTVLSLYLKEQYHFNFVEQAKLLESYGCHVDDTVLSLNVRDVAKKTQNAGRTI